MKPDKQRIAIAEACGWKMVECNRAFPPKEIVDFILKEYPLTACIDHCEIPDYLNDLNAIRGAENEFLLGGKFETKPMTYLNELEKIRHREGQDWSRPSIHLELFFAMATASQRAEAFLKTLGLWTDSNDEQSPIHKQPSTTTP